MGLPADFVFTQSNLQAFLDCRQLFRLRYLKKISWPAPITDPVLEHERHMQRGSIFHHMVQQPILAYGSESIGDLSRFFKDHQFHMKHLMVEIACRSALQTNSGADQPAVATSSSPKQ